MKRIYIYGHKKVGNRILLTGEPVHYLKNVLRMKTDSCFSAFDGTGTEYILEIKTLSDQHIDTQIKEEKQIRKKSQR